MTEASLSTPRDSGRRSPLASIRDVLDDTSPMSGASLLITSIGMFAASASVLFPAAAAVKAVLFALVFVAELAAQVAINVLKRKKVPS